MDCGCQSQHTPQLSCSWPISVPSIVGRPFCYHVNRRNDVSRFVRYFGASSEECRLLNQGWALFARLGRHWTDRYLAACPRIAALVEAIRDPFQYAESFDLQYAVQSDPWNYSGSPAEHECHRAALDLLDDVCEQQRFGRVLEIGC